MCKDEIDAALKLLISSDSSINLKEVIPYIKGKVEEYIKTHKPDSVLVLKNLLTPSSYGVSWAIAQSHSILHYIEHLNSDNFHKIVSGDIYLTNITQKFIIDFKNFNTFLRELRLPPIYDPSKDKILTDIFMDRYAKSAGAFITSKLKTYYPGAPSPLMYEYEANVTPFFIRHAIELKVKCEMLGIDKVIRIKKDGTPVQAIINISKYINFLNFEGKKFFDLPPEVNIDEVQIVNQWSNNFIHEGEHEYVWQVKSAISAIEPLFIIDYKGVLAIHGHTFRSEHYTPASLKKSLEEKFMNLKFFIDSTI